MNEKGVYPREINLGENCAYWQQSCVFPKAEVEGRMSCDGIIDPICIFLIDGRRVKGFSLTEEQVMELKTTPPLFVKRNYSIPADKPIEVL